MIDPIPANARKVRLVPGPWPVDTGSGGLPSAHHQAALGADLARARPESGLVRTDPLSRGRSVVLLRVVKGLGAGLARLPPGRERAGSGYLWRSQMPR